MASSSGLPTQADGNMPLEVMSSSSSSCSSSSNGVMAIEVMTISTNTEQFHIHGTEEIAAFTSMLDDIRIQRDAEAAQIKDELKQVRSSSSLSCSAAASGCMRISSSMEVKAAAEQLKEKLKQAKKELKKEKFKNHVLLSRMAALKTSGGGR